jgi:hypothetical protein
MTPSRRDLNRLHGSISSLPAIGTIVTAIIRKDLLGIEKVLVHPFRILAIVAIIYSNPNQNGAGNLKCFLSIGPNTIAACLLGKLHVPSTHHVAVVSSPFDQGKDVELGGLLGRCNWNRPMDLVTMHRYVGSRCCSEGSWERSI